MHTVRKMLGAFELFSKLNSIVDVRCCPEFCFKQITFHSDKDNVFLGLFFQPWLTKKQSKNISAKYRIIQRFFDINIPKSALIDEPQEVAKEDGEDGEREDEEDTSNTIAMPSVSELYSMLRESHEKNTEETEHHALMPTYFVPKLRSYQARALQWMLNREKTTKYSIPEFVPIKCPSIPSETFFYNYRTVELMDYDPGCSEIPTGGILADEMGLGKTVEMLALILSNPNLKRKRKDTDNTNAGRIPEGQQGFRIV